MNRVLVLAALVAACGRTETTPPAGAAPIASGSASAVEAPPAAAPPPPSEFRFTAAWSKVVASQNCFFFSGPDGRDDKLVGTIIVRRDEPDRIELRFGDAVFTGTATNGELNAVRESTHDSEGTWRVRETLKGRIRAEREMHAKYRYEECQVGAPCPGQCRIDAELTFAKPVP